MYKIEISKSESGPWLDSNKFYLPLLVDLKKESDHQGEVIATYEVDGKKSPLIIKNSSGINLLFDLEKTCHKILNEEYKGAELNHGIFAKLPFDYNKFPTWFIGFMSNLLTKKIDIKELPSFPNYPLDYSVDMLKTLSNKRTSPWPNNKKYAVCFTHDVDTDWVFRNEAWFNKFRAAEENHGITSAWYIVPQEIKSQKTKKFIKSLVSSGHEIGAHGYTHSPGLPLQPEHKLKEYLRKSHGTISELYDDEIGYRAPWLARNSNMFEALHEVGFMYDSSVPNSDFNGNNALSNNGCCTVFPYVRNGIPVLPLTIPLDGISKSLSKSPMEFYDWVLDIVKQIKQMGGAVVITTHTTPHFSANEEMMNAYNYIIKKLTADEDAWVTLPRNIVSEFMKRT